MSEKSKQRVQVEQLEDAFTVLIDALEDYLVKLGVVLTKVTRLVGVLVHGLNDRFKISLSLHLQNIVRIVFHAFFLLINRLKEVSNLLDGHFVFVLDGFDHSLLKQLRDFVSEALKALYVTGKHLFSAVVGRCANLLLDHLHQGHTFRCEVRGHLQIF